MLDPYKMVIVSSIASLIILLGIGIYKYIFPKKKLNLLILIFLISLPPIVSIFRTGSYESGDFTIHLYRTIEFYGSLSEGIIFPSWAGGLNATYGYALFIFNYSLPYYLISFFHLIGFSFISSMKLFLAVNFILSGIFMFLCTKKLFKNDIAAFTASVFYQFAPYHLIGLHFKIVIGEILTFTLLPLTFFFLQKLLEKKNGVWFSLTSISIALLVMSHVVLALFSMILFFFFALFRMIQAKKKSILFITIATCITGSICSIYVWLTPFFMTQYTIFKDVIDFVYFPKFVELLFSPWKYGFLFQGSQGELSYLLGYTHILVVVLLIFFLFHKKFYIKYKGGILFWLFTFVILIFLITPASKFLWGLSPFLKVTGSQRLLVLTAFVSAILAGYISMHLLKRRLILIALIVLTIFSTILNWGHRRVIPEISDSTLINNVWKSTSEGEGHFYANSKWRTTKNPWFTKLPDDHLQTVTGTAAIKEIDRTSTKHTYLIHADSPTTLIENTLYFPGWQVTNNKKPIIIQPNKEGVITFQLPKGLHFVEVIYNDPFIYSLLKLISVTGFVTLLSILLISWRRVYGQ